MIHFQHISCADYGRCGVATTHLHTNRWSMLIAWYRIPLIRFRRVTR